MIRSARTLIPLLLVAAAGLVDAQGVPNGTRRSPEMLQAFRSIVTNASRSTVRVKGDGKEVALATVVSPDGLLITKYSELERKGKLTCDLRDGRQVEAKIVGIESKYDLALLKVEASGLTPVEWVSSSKAEAGDWLATPGPGDSPLAVGVVGVPTRKPGKRDYPANPPDSNSGYLGVFLKDGEGPATIGGLEKTGPAAKAGLKVDDIILSVAGRKVANAEKLIETVQKYKAGEKVTLKIKRNGPNGSEEEIDLELGKRPAAPGGFDRGDFQNKMGSTLSKKRQGFPVILQHDMVVKPTDCGGPVVNLEGKAVGVNIARAGRTESYAIPSEAVVALLPDLRSGKLAPKPEEISAEEQRFTRRRTLEKEIEDTNATIRMMEKKIETLRLIDDDSDKRQMMEKQIAIAKKKLVELQGELEKLKKSK
ncbi:MAG: PDZ domain-containing protein [Planctomycetia bacterium]|nr:PDZ domain-containing protein [Planctomycetia bacterium]